MSKVTEDMLPELPEKVVTDTHLPTGVRIWGYTAAQMRDYARAALEAALSQGEAVAWLSKDDAQLALFKAIQSIKYGDPTDDKMILANLRGAGLWIGRYEYAQPAPQSEPAGELSKLAVWWRNRAGPWDQVIKKNPENIAAATVLYECADELEKALAATGKQSGSESEGSFRARSSQQTASAESNRAADELIADARKVMAQHDERERFDVWAEMAGHDTTITKNDPILIDGVYVDGETNAAWVAWQAATASRETVGVEPVAVVGSDFTICWVGSGPIAPLMERNGIKKGSLLYTATPAQGVDLGPLREFIADCAANRDDVHIPNVRSQRAIALLQLIDQQRDSGAR